MPTGVQEGWVCQKGSRGINRGADERGGSHGRRVRKAFWFTHGPRVVKESTGWHCQSTVAPTPKPQRLPPGPPRRPHPTQPTARRSPRLQRPRISPPDLRTRRPQQPSLRSCSRMQIRSFVLSPASREPPSVASLNPLQLRNNAPRATPQLQKRKPHSRPYAVPFSATSLRLSAVIALAPSVARLP